MTDFTHDNELNDDDSTNEPQSLSLLGGVVDGDTLPEAGDADFEMSKPAGSSAVGGTILLIALVVVLGAGGIYAMSLRNNGIIGGMTSPETESKMREFLARITADKMSGRSTQDEFNATTEIPDEILQVFELDPTQKQVPIDFVKKNPFERTQKVAAQETNTDTQNHNNVQREAERQRQRLQKELAGLELQSVIGGRRPVAMINGDLVQKNQRIGSFIVADIRDMKVYLKAGETVFELAMDDPETDNPNVRRR